MGLRAEHTGTTQANHRQGVWQQSPQPLGGYGGLGAKRRAFFAIFQKKIAILALFGSNFVIIWSNLK